ncbi:MAG TPA: serine hydrolase domain-containing protein [Gemmatimonadales bacterium]|nr:serine hydrolase domain-containing protein [Gemmatimonadales bacterium]
MTETAAGSPAPHRALHRAFAVLTVLLLGGPVAAAAQEYQQVDAVVKHGIREGLYPGAVVVIGRRDTVLYSQGFGHLTWGTRSPRPTPTGTLWDLASLTKVVATTSSMMVLVENGAVDLDAPISRYLPRFVSSGTDPRRGRVTVRMLLDHTSGLPAWRPFVHLARTREAALTLLYSTPLARSPGDTAVYSDLNAILLGELVHTVSGEPLDRFAARNVFQPIGMSRTLFKPPRSMWRDAAPSAVYRGRPVVGVANDGNAVRLGGVAGHAGLFSTGSDLARYAQAWLGYGRTGTGVMADPATVLAFLQRTPASGTRLLGWDTADTLMADPSVFGTRLTPSAYGHTGWTGTELWVDPGQDLFMVFLTNRSYKPRGGRSIERLRELRAHLSDAVVASTTAAASPMHQGR